ncbi:MAG: SAF domain-containing protein [Nocardioidaceae bacterium]
MARSRSLADVRRSLRSVRRAVLLRRRPLAALLAGLAVLGALRVVSPPPPPSVTVTVAARDLAAGTVLTASDLTVVAMTPGSVPDGLAGAPGGRTLAAPLRRGEPVTDLRLVGPGLASGYPGLVVLPVRFPDQAAASLLRPGDDIDVLAADGRARSTTVVATGARVVTLLPESSDRTQLPAGALVLLAVHPDEAVRVVSSQVGHFITYVQTD